MSLRTRVMRLESRWEPDDLIAALQAWVKSLPVDDVRCLAAFTETAEPFPEQRYRMTKQDAHDRANRLDRERSAASVSAVCSRPGGVTLPSITAIRVMNRRP